MINWMAVEAELYAIDNLGNEYKVPYNGGTGTKVVIRVKISHGMQQFMVLTEKQHPLRFIHLLI